MLAVQGIYENGQIKLLGEQPKGNAEVLVIFNVSKEDDVDVTNNDMATRRLFDEFTGCINRKIDEKAERLEALDEKYASAN